MILDSRLDLNMSKDPEEQIHLRLAELIIEAMLVLINLSRLLEDDSPALLDSILGLLEAQTEHCLPMSKSIIYSWPSEKVPKYIHSLGVTMSVVNRVPTGKITIRCPEVNRSGRK